MRDRFFELAFTPAVRAQQARYGSLRAYGRAPAIDDQVSEGLSDDAAAFLESRDGFFLASVSETGWPYVQHRGGPSGFLKVLGPTTIGWADFRGNRQYVSVGNASVHDRVAIIAMDWARQARLKLLGRMRVTEAEADPDLAAALAVPGYRAKVERVALVEVAAFDWNCPQHITPRYTMAEVEQAVVPLRRRIAELEAKLAAARGPA